MLRRTKRRDNDFLDLRRVVARSVPIWDNAAQPICLNFVGPN
jgi:hypothetical protein